MSDGFTTGLQLRDKSAVPCILPQNRELAAARWHEYLVSETRKDLRQLLTAGILFLSLDNGEPLGSVPSELCGHSLEVLQLSWDARVRDPHSHVSSLPTFLP